MKSPFSVTECVFRVVELPFRDAERTFRDTEQELILYKRNN